MMKTNNCIVRPSRLARGLAALCAALMVAAGLGARPAQAAPFAYVTNISGQTVSVIDTATNTVAATVPLGGTAAFGIAVTPDGKHAYLAHLGFCDCVTVIDTASNTVVADIRLEDWAQGVAVTPDGKYVYVGEPDLGTFSVINTASNTVAAADIPACDFPWGIAVAPDGKHVYLTDPACGVLVIDTATNSVMAKVPVGGRPYGVAVTPDGKYAYVANSGDNTVSVIDTAANNVVATVPVAAGARWIAITPDGKNAYVATNTSSVAVIATATNAVITTIPTPAGAGDIHASTIAITPDGKSVYVASNSNIVTVIATATNSVVATVTVGNGAEAIAIIPDIPFSFFSSKLVIAPSHNYFELLSDVTLGSGAAYLDPPGQPVTVQVGSFSATIPAGSFVKGSTFGEWDFDGTVNGTAIHAKIWLDGTKQYEVLVKGSTKLSGVTNPVPVTLTLGPNSGTASVTAAIYP
jgi:YVTN family beta-propeller protein